VLINLLTNGIKYNRPGGSVTARLEASGNGHIRIAIIDTGPGIPDSLLPRLFVPFDRLGAEGGQVEGTGLGLSVARGLVEGMGGTIEVVSRETGTAFRVELPSAPAMAARAIPEPAPVAEPLPDPILHRSVLIVEDNEPNRDLLERVLRRVGDLSVHAVATGAAAVCAARAAPPDLVLLDLGLPDMDGAEVLRQLLADPATSSVPIAILSADATDDRRDELLAAGATRYLTKPFQVGELTRAVAELLAPERRSAASRAEATAPAHQAE
jgi:CheY-like chemotaxis protein